MNTIIIGIGGDDLPEVSGVPEGWTVILRDYRTGNAPDPNGDLYEDTVLIDGGLVTRPPTFLPPEDELPGPNV